MYTSGVPRDHPRDLERTGLPDVGERLRERRLRLDMPLRELARRLSVSPSLISQIELGKVNPSVATLYAMTTELDMSLDSLFSSSRSSPPAASGVASRADPGSATASSAPSEATDHRVAFAELQSRENGSRSGGVGPVVRPGERERIQLDSGVRWERLTPSSDPDVDFLYVVYEPGGASCETGVLMRHPGREYGQVLSGTLEVTVAFDAHILHAGDSISFDSTVPHRLATVGDEPVTAIWLVVGRQGDRRS
jgi:transcriptional regulator with XRE-family HTH domain/quercetin dioxygenase-like cupin family protein